MIPWADRCNFTKLPYFHDRGAGGKVRAGFGYPRSGAHNAVQAPYPAPSLAINSSSAPRVLSRLSIRSLRTIALLMSVLPWANSRRAARISMPSSAIKTLASGGEEETRSTSGSRPSLVLVPGAGAGAKI